jgi:hypothetical protein
MPDKAPKAELSEATQELLRALADRERTLLDITFRLFHADGGKMFTVDLIAAAAANRSLNLLSGFKAMIEARNLVCAVAILRLQLDTAMRFSALSLVDDPNSLAEQVLKGTPLRRVKDRNGAPMTDARLVEIFSLPAPWIRDVYDLGCDYVHLSGAHVRHVFGPGKDPGKATLQVGASDPVDLDESNYTEAIFGFQASVDLLCHAIASWVSVKEGHQADPDTTAT